MASLACWWPSDDITERKGLQEQLHQAQKLESIGRLAGGVAHDFNNLLTVINGYSDLVLQRLHQNDPNWSRVDQIRKAGDRAAELTRQLLAFSRKQVIKPQTLDRELPDPGNRTHAAPPAARNHRNARCISLWPLHVMADPGQLNQVLINLAVNARDAMPEGGTLMVETDSVELDEEFADHHPGLVPGPYVRLAISDSGVGMSADVRNHVFEPFFTTKNKGRRVPVWGWPPSMASSARMAVGSGSTASRSTAPCSKSISRAWPGGTGTPRSRSAPGRLLPRERNRARGGRSGGCAEPGQGGARVVRLSACW